MRVYNIFLSLSLLLFSALSFASVSINDVLFDAQAKSGKITVKYSGQLNGYPELKIVGKVIQVTIPNAKVKKDVKRYVSFSSKTNDTSLTANQLSATTSKIKAVFPFLVSAKKEQVALTILDNQIELTFPRVMVAVKEKKIAQEAPVKKEFLNEDYLNSLIKVEKPVEKKIERAAMVKAVRDPMKEDLVQTTLAAPVKTKTKSSISMVEYGGKFLAFLGVVLLLFYGVITLMKKGFIKKGKLGFLNNTDQVVVLNQTYIAPKKSLMLIKAHKQVFLVSNTDSGIHPISEIKDVAGLFKDGEKALSGFNFDTDINESSADETIENRVKIKEDITKSNQESSLTSYLDVKDKVKFSEQIKKKVKNLKQLQ